MEELLCPEDPLVPRDPYTNKQGLVCREKHDICRAGQRQLKFPERCAPQKMGRKGLQICIDSPERVYTLHLPKCPLLLPGGEGRPALLSGAAWLSWRCQGEDQVWPVPCCPSSPARASLGCWAEAPLMKEAIAL